MRGSTKAPVKGPGRSRGGPRNAGAPFAPRGFAADGKPAERSAAGRAAAQRVAEPEELEAPAQLQEEDEEEDEMLQGKFSPAQRTGAAGEPGSRGGEGNLPDDLRDGVESLSGVAMGDVKVHYNSSKPAQVDALAYAQGSDIHLASGQEKHLPHEAWHVAQQAQGRVKPTMKTDSGVPVNDDPGLEREADVKGTQAAQHRRREPDEGS